MADPHHQAEVCAQVDELLIRTVALLQVWLKTEPDPLGIVAELQKDILDVLGVPP